MNTKILRLLVTLIILTLLPLEIIVVSADTIDKGQDCLQDEDLITLDNVPVECADKFIRLSNQNPDTNEFARVIRPSAIANPIQDPGFESYTPNPNWGEYSYNFGTPLCTLGVCGNGDGTAGPRTGSVWVWFGGTNVNELAFVTQDITIPIGASSLQFYFWIGAAAAGSDSADIFSVDIDGSTVFSANATQKNSYSSYTQIWVDIRGFADGGVHTLDVWSETTGQLVNFNVDDFSISDVSFADVSESHPYFTDIEILYRNGYTSGCSISPLKFCPDVSMSRAQSAVFMLRGNFGSGYVPVTPTHIFKDNWKNSSWGEGWAESMYIEGLTAGCSSSPFKFCPDEILTNVQLAVFGLRLKHGISYPTPTPTGTVFADMTDTGFWGTGWAEQAYAEGLIPSCGTDVGTGLPKFCPNALVSRGFGASVIVNAKNLTMP